ncbi:DUF2254 domain-containing protein [Marinicella gelatinilytica]|uniref:DUF2254 domain-containing protein n=1 Tax=Marinicella gelatinilytica TaxID=2996017 RepID=UPI00226094D8|nr:DUF2254 domain-containing protein [Marinicella gelatinilytica]MCX7544431.1 DUF2254 domain-containing protein [Marinicella gelatinilytica]
MINPVKKSLHFFVKLERQIAFYPSVMALAGLFLALVMIYLEQLGLSQFFIKHVPIVMVQSFETARTILGTFIGGFISILVFSFSMVMILLNQAAANFSPRLLPGLVSNKKHQIILGIYLASLFFCLLALMLIQSEGKEVTTPGSMILMAILMMATSLTAFIYFIHSISKSIQVDHILHRIYHDSADQFIRLLEAGKDNDKSPILTKSPADFSADDKWTLYHSETTGYLSAVDTGALLKLMQKDDNQMQILVGRSYYMLAGTPLFRTRKLVEDGLAKDIHKQFLIESSVSVSDNEDLGFKVITEIAVKAMSPGINDPGTALTCIDYLTQLLALRLRYQPRQWFQDKVDDDENNNTTTRVQIKTLDFEDLLFQIMAPFRTYCAHDILIVLKLLYMHKNLIQIAPTDFTENNRLKSSAKLLTEHAFKHIQLTEDKRRIEYLYSTL